MQAVKLPGKLSIYWQLILVFVTIAIVFLIQSCGVQNKHGATTPDRIVEQYLLALADRDEAAMLRLLPENAALADINQVKAKITKIGGFKIQDHQISYTKSKPTLWKAKVHGFYINLNDVRQKFDDSIEIEYQSKGQVKLYGGRWYLLLGDRE
jgi:hypothetical protein